MKIFELYCKDNNLKKRNLLITIKGNDYSEVKQTLLSVEGNHQRQALKATYETVENSVLKYRFKKIKKYFFIFSKITYHILALGSIITLATLGILKLL